MTTTTTQGATGRIARVIGPVVDVEFPAGQVPDIYNALTTELTLDGKTTPSPLRLLSIWVIRLFVPSLCNRLTVLCVGRLS